MTPGARVAGPGSWRRASGAAKVCPKCPQPTGAMSWAGSKGYEVVSKLCPKHMAQFNAVIAGWDKAAAIEDATPGLAGHVPPLPPSTPKQP